MCSLCLFQVFTSASETCPTTCPNALPTQHTCTSFRPTCSPLEIPEILCSPLNFYTCVLCSLDSLFYLVWLALLSLPHFLMVLFLVLALWLIYLSSIAPVNSVELSQEVQVASIPSFCKSVFSSFAQSALFTAQLPTCPGSADYPQSK